MRGLQRQRNSSTSAGDLRAENTHSCRCEIALGRSLRWGLGYTECKTIHIHGSSKRGHGQVGGRKFPRSIWVLNKESLRQAILTESSLYSWEEQLAGARAREGSAPCEEPYSCPYLLTQEMSSWKNNQMEKKIPVVRKTLICPECGPYFFYHMNLQQTASPGKTVQSGMIPK